MPITFENLPSTIRVPGFYVEFDPTSAQAGPVVKPRRGLLIGQRLSTGAVAQLVATRLFTADQASLAFGARSELAAMAAAWFATDPATEVWAVALDDPIGAQATATVTVGGTPTAAGTIHLYVAGVHVPVAVSTTDTCNTIAAAIAAAVNAAPSLPVTANSNLCVATLTAAHKGVIGQEIDVRLNYQVGDQLPAGLTGSVVGMVGGTGSVNLPAVWPVIGEQQYDSIACPLTDSTNLSSLEAELADRWGPIRRNDGRAFSAHSGNLSTVSTFGLTRNSPHVCYLSTYRSPTPTWAQASVAAALVSRYAGLDPARPFQSLTMPGVQAPAVVDRFRVSERDVLLHSGISTTLAGADGSVALERLITSYRLNALGVPDTSYLDVNTLETLSFLRYSFRNTFALRYPRAKLAQDGVRYAAGQPIITPSTAKAEAISIFRQWEEQGLVEDVEQFKRDLVVERDASDPNRLNFLLPPNLINQFVVAGVRVGFLL